MAKTALIIVDMVRDFTDPEGLVFYPENQKILPRIKKVLDESRKHELLIVFLQHCNRKDKVDKKAQSMRPNCIEGTFGIEIDPMLEVDEKKDYVKRKIGHALNKAAPSFFKREPLAALLIGLVNLCLMLWTYSAPAMCSAVCKMNTKMARIPVALYPISVRHTVHGGGEIPSR